jgi:hypothetical protein
LDPIHLILYPLDHIHHILCAVSCSLGSYPLDHTRKVQWGTGKEHPPQLFNLSADPNEMTNLATGSGSSEWTPLIQELDALLQQDVQYPQVLCMSLLATSSSSLLALHHQPRTPPSVPPPPYPPPPLFPTGALQLQSSLSRSPPSSSSPPLHSTLYLPTLQVSMDVATYNLDMAKWWTGPTGEPNWRAIVNGTGWSDKKSPHDRLECLNPDWGQLWQKRPPAYWKVCVCVCTPLSHHPSPLPHSSTHALQTHPRHPFLVPLSSTLLHPPSPPPPSTLHILAGVGPVDQFAADYRPVPVGTRVQLGHLRHRSHLRRTCCAASRRRHRRCHRRCKVQGSARRASRK